MVTAMFYKARESSSLRHSKTLSGWVSKGHLIHFTLQSGRCLQGPNPACCKALRSLSSFPVSKEGIMVSCPWRGTRPQDSAARCRRWAKLLYGIHVSSWLRSCSLLTAHQPPHALLSIFIHPKIHLTHLQVCLSTP